MVFDPNSQKHKRLVRFSQDVGIFSLGMVFAWVPSTALIFLLPSWMTDLPIIHFVLGSIIGYSMVKFSHRDDKEGSE